MLKKILPVVLAFPLFVFAQQKQPYENLTQALISTRRLIGKPGPRSLNWIDGGNEYSYTKMNPLNSTGDIHLYDPENGKDELIFNNAGMKFPGTDIVFDYNSFQWAHDSKHILFKTNAKKLYRKSAISDYYFYSLGNKTLKLAVQSARTAELSPDGSMIGIEREGNMFIYNFNANKETQLTFDTSSDIYNGHYDWVYEEEFDQPVAWNWSPDSKYIAYWHFDEAGVPVFQMTNFEGTHPEYVKIPIPQPGDPNPKVKIGVIDVHTGKNIWLNTETDSYIPRIYWTSEPNILAVMTLNRSQNDMKLFFFNIKTGERKLVLEEKSNTWVSIDNFYMNVNNMMFFPDKIKEFFWVSDRSGYYQIYRYDYDGKLINRVTNGSWDVFNVVGINPDSKTIYYTSAEASPLQQQLYSIKFDGEDEHKLTQVTGLHRIDMSPNCKYYIDEYSNTKLPRQVELWNTNGKMLKKLENNSQVTDYIKTYDYSYKDLFSFITTDGVKLDCSMIKPILFDSTKKYPVVLSIYGGPESHGVSDSFEFSGWDEYLAQQGYIVVDVNNRGNTGYGRDFMKIVYKHLGKWESHDFVETADYLKKLPYVDSSKFAIMGGSYGGYITIFTMLTHPGVFEVGIANSAVTDWRLYDDIYTERYMGLLNDNLQGYINSSDITYADSLHGHLLLIHSMSDDNVHVRNTMQLLTALTNAGKDADLRIYPLGAHGAEYNFASDLLMHKVYFQYLQRYLKGKGDLPNINTK
jgi:dipeptidyl-peptidase 4